MTGRKEGKGGGATSSAGHTTCWAPGQAVPPQQKATRDPVKEKASCSVTYRRHGPGTEELLSHLCLIVCQQT